MSILIKDMNMPTSCDDCPLIAEADDYHVCYINEQFIPWEWIDEHSAEQKHPRPSWCPLVEIPPHGRLIDADAIAEEIIKNIKQYAYEADGGYYLAEDALESVQFAPTIIEAEEGE